MRKSRTTKSTFKRFLGEYSVEILAAIVVIIGLGLIKLDKSALMAAIQNTSQWFLSAVKNLRRISISDLIGPAAVVGGTVVVLWRIRFHIQRSERWRVQECPRCGTSLHRIHRTPVDKLVGFVFMPHSRRFRCDNPDCRWTGLRYGRRHTDPIV